MSEPTLSLTALWRLLTPEEQVEAAASFWRSKSPLKKRVAPHVVSALAAALSFRDKFLVGKPLEWRAVELTKRLGYPPLDSYIDDVVREFLIEHRRDMIRAVLDGEGTPHDQGWIKEGVSPPSCETFIRGLEAARGKYHDRDLVLYYGIQVLAGTGDHWGALRDAIERPEFQQLFDGVLAGESAPPPKDAAAEAQPPIDSEANEEFTTLDRLLIKTVVATATGIDGALGADALDDLVHEVLSLNGDRHRSYFHLGYLDAVLGRGFHSEFTGWNVARRGWTLTGYVMGFLRSADTPQLVSFIKTHQKLWDELYDEGPPSARTMLLRHCLVPLSEAGEWRLLKGLLERAPLPADQRESRRLCIHAYESAADLIRRGNAADAVPLLEILFAHLRRTSSLGEDFVNGASASCLRKLGQAHLRTGNFPLAKQLLSQVIELSEFPESANACADLGLAEAGFRSLDFILPKEDQASNETTVRALEGSNKRFQEAITCKGRPTNAHFVLAIIAFHRGRSAEAEDHLSHALPGMLEKEEAYQTGCLLDWVRFLLAIIIAEQCEPARLNEVRDHIEKAIASAASFPLHLWTKFCRAVMLYDDKSLAEKTILHLLDKRGEAAYGLLKESGLLTTNGALRLRYRDWLQSRTLSPAKKAEELQAVLKAALADGQCDEAAEVLDALEGLAKTASVCIPGFLALLKDRRAEILACWDEDDLDRTEAALLERIGQIEACVAPLLRLFYRLREQEDWPRIDELLQQFDRLKAPSVDVAQMRAQTEHIRPPIPVLPPSGPCLTGMRVLYVGGNETQMRYESEIRRQLERKHPGLQVTFRYPGWDSNWGTHLGAITRLFPDHDVVVINHFIRTLLGRGLRRACGRDIPWRACTGHGRDSLCRSIEEAARFVAERRSAAVEL